MIDLHCHILPGIDDGAKDLKEAVAMLHMQRSSGVEAMIMTPHFHPKMKNVDAFLTERNNAWEKLEAVLFPENNYRICLGAEVRYCEQLLTVDLRKLTLGERNYLLLELPATGYPAFLARTMEYLLSEGIIPILAHVERYAYFRNDPNLLKRLSDIGSLSQVSAQALFSKQDRHFAYTCLKHGLAQIIASDAHNLTSRKPNMDLLQKLPKELQQIHEAFSVSVWENESPPYLRATSIKKSLFGYR